MKTHEKVQGGHSPVHVGAAQRRSVGYDTIAPEATARAVADYEERLHAVRSGLAAVSGALHVLLSDSAADAGSHDRLGSALVAEVERLQRLTAPSAGAVGSRGPLDLDTVLDLDAVIGAVVLARRMAGQEIAWAPSGTRVLGSADDLAEVLNIIVVNAFRHAQGAPARIQVTADSGEVRIRISDDGPGVPVALCDSIFERGVRRPGSPGQGIGLAMARALTEGLGGTVSVSPSSSGGACFCVSLPAVGQGEA